MGLETAIIGGLGMLGGGIGSALAASQPVPSPNKAYAGAVIADVSTLPMRLAAMYGAATGKKVKVTSPISGKTFELDFEGIGDVQRSKELLEAGFTLADIAAGKGLELREKYAEKYIQQALKQLDLVDAVGKELQKQYASTVLDYLRGKVPAGVAEQIREAERAAQAARGTLMSPAGAAREALEIGKAGLALQQAGLAAVPTYFGAVSPLARMSGLTAVQASAAPAAPVMPAVTSTQFMNQGAGMAGMQTALQAYQLQQAYNPWAQFFGQVGGMGAAMLGTAMRTQSILGMLKQMKGMFPKLFE